MHGLRSRFLVLILLLGITPPLAAQDDDQTPPPEMPSLDQVLEDQQVIPEYVPLNVDFRIGLVGEYSKEIMTPGGPQAQIKNPLILINPSNGQIGVYAKDFPARIVANSPNGSWIIGVAESSSVEGSSGSRQQECAVSLNMTDNEINIIEEFPLFSKFQAYFAPRDNNVIYYCVNEPATVNSIVNYNLRTEEGKPLDIEGNRFYLHGIKPTEPRGLWVTDPFSLNDYPDLDLVDLNDGHTMDNVSFPGCTQVLPSPDGNYILGVVENKAEASLGYFNLTDKSFHQVPDLVLTRPTLKWTHNGLTVMAKESTATRDRFLLVDLTTGKAREIWSDYFKILFWDVSPADDALVFVVDSEKNPLLYVIPLDPTVDAINRIRLNDVSNISWIGCLNPPSGGGSWLDRLLPF